jgi:lysophospholipid acyltransferase (LPLAT)-like uncharacterized protein
VIEEAVEDRVRFAWLARLFGWVLAGYVDLVAKTARVTGPPINQGQVIFAIWHESNMGAAIAAWKLRTDKQPVVFSTRGFRGIVMNTMLRRLGASVVTLPDEGTATRAEAAALTRELARFGRSGASLVISCDGPFGPYRVAKPGVAIVARESGLPIQPWAVASRPPFRLRGRWDRMLVPLPFGRMRVFEGAPITVGPRDRLKPPLADLQGELERVQSEADRLMG